MRKSHDDTRGCLFSRTVSATTRCSISTLLEFQLRRLPTVVATMKLLQQLLSWVESKDISEVENIQGCSISMSDDEPMEAPTSCDICRLLQPPWPILLKRHVLLGSKCPCCELIRTILHPYASNSSYRPSHRAISIDFADKYMAVKLIGSRNLDKDILFHVNAVEGIFVSGVLKGLQRSNVSFRNTMPLAKYT
jgi:hypothetical protein